MIDRHLLLSDLTKLLRHLEDDIRRRCDDQPDVDRAARAEWDFTREAGRTANDYTVWREGWITQAAAAWILGAVFVRFMEDNGLISPPFVSGPGERLAVARDCRTHYYNGRPADSDRDYLLHVFTTVSKLPAAADIFDCRHNPIWKLGPTGDGATRLLEFWQRIDPASGTLAHDFTDLDLDTRFLGDLYQDLSEDARKKYALLQTPEFVEEFILDRTLTPAIEEFGYREVRLIDPACGSGHFLLGAFHRLLDISQRHEPAVNVRELARRVLANVCGVDVNPFAVAIARFRLLVAALRACGIARLEQAPAFPLNVYTGDSLLHGKRFSGGGALQMSLDEDDPIRRALATEDAKALKRVLGRQYHAVVGNPPYVTVKDKALNEAYRQRYRSCHMKYSLAVPFMERLFELAFGGERAGFVGTITANSFMKREFGKKVIEKYIPRWDLTHVIDTSGAYIPGHGTPTVILFGRNRPPVASTIRAVMGIRGEPQTPAEPSKGLVWTAVLGQIDRAGSESAFVSVSDLERSSLRKHPWSIGGGGATDLKQEIDGRADRTLGEVAEVVGIFGMTNADELFISPCAAFRRWRVDQSVVRRLVVGDEIRDWTITDGDDVFFPYEREDLIDLDSLPVVVQRWLWPARSVLGNRATFSKLTYFAEGRPWWEWHQVCQDRLRTPLSIAFAFVATHNHFVLDRGGKVFNRTAPVIKLPAEGTEDGYLAILGLLNSSTACFWMKETFFDRGNGGIGGGIASEEWERFFEHDGTKLRTLPVPRHLPLALARTLSQVSTTGAASSIRKTLDRTSSAHEPFRAALVRRRTQLGSSRSAAIALQEELDWEVYGLYGLLADDLCYHAQDLPGINLGERAFEIVMASKITAGELETKWFERHGSTPITELPSHWPEAYRQLVERRIAMIESDKWIGLIEQPEFKRRWNVEPWDEQQARALRSWLLDRLESSVYWPSLELTTCARLAERAKHDAECMEVAEVYRGHAEFDVAKLVAELVMDEAVPYLPAQRYKESGLRKREVWERTWDLQRREDTIDARVDLPEGDKNRLTAEQAKALKAREIGDIPVPPKYTSPDFKSGPSWRLRGKLDVPKERFISYPGASREADPSTVVAWAGWDHLQQAQALSAYYVFVKEQDGWSGERLQPLLAGLRALLPWLKQWHNELDSETGLRLGDYFADFVDAEERALAGRG